LEAERANDGWLVPVRASIACKSPCEIQFYPQKSQAIMVEAVKSETAEEPIPRQEASDDVDLQEELSDDDSEFNELFEAPLRAKEGPFHQENAIRLLKAMTVVVTMLLAVKAVLYLI